MELSRIVCGYMVGQWVISRIDEWKLDGIVAVLAPNSWYQMVNIYPVVRHTWM